MAMIAEAVAHKKHNPGASEVLGELPSARVKK